MKTKNLPVVVEVVPKGTICHECRKPIKKKQIAIKYWWVKKSDRYSHFKCASKKK